MDQKRLQKRGSAHSHRLLGSPIKMGGQRCCNHEEQKANDERTTASWPIPSAATLHNNSDVDDDDNDEYGNSGEVEAVT